MTEVAFSFYLLVNVYPGTDLFTVPGIHFRNDELTEIIHLC